MVTRFKLEKRYSMSQLGRAIAVNLGAHGRQNSF